MHGPIRVSTDDELITLAAEHSDVDIASTRRNEHLHYLRGQFVTGGYSGGPFGYSLRKPDQHNDQDDFFARRKLVEPCA
jgi:hypothetical protein